MALGTLWQQTFIQRLVYTIEILVIKAIIIEPVSMFTTISVLRVNTLYTLCLTFMQLKNTQLYQLHPEVLLKEDKNKYNYS